MNPILLLIVGLYLIFEAIGSILFFYTFPQQELFNFGRIIRVAIGAVLIAFSIKGIKRVLLKRSDWFLLVGLVLLVFGASLLVHHSIVSGRPFDLDQFFFFIPICHGLIGLIFVFVGVVFELCGLLRKNP